jgi:hypothetical protein
MAMDITTGDAVHHQLQALGARTGLDLQWPIHTETVRLYFA